MEQKLYKCVCCGQEVDDKKAYGVLVDTKVEYGRTGEKSIDLITSIIWCKVSNADAPVHFCWQCADNLAAAAKYRREENSNE